jgi:hypothetical protein
MCVLGLYRTLKATLVLDGPRGVRIRLLPIIVWACFRNCFERVDYEFVLHCSPTGVSCGGLGHEVLPALCDLHWGGLHDVSEARRLHTRGQATLKFKTTTPLWTPAATNRHSPPSALVRSMCWVLPYAYRVNYVWCC